MDFVKDFFIFLIGLSLVVVGLGLSWYGGLWLADNVHVWLTPVPFLVFLSAYYSILTNL